jgi:hypothetical protein
MEYKGMTVNERLYVSGFLDQYDKAVTEKDVDKIREILQKVELNEISIKSILEQLGLDSTQK